MPEQEGAEDLSCVDAGVLETIPYGYPGRRARVEYVYPEFTSLCPYTGMPDFGELRIAYVPDRRLVELKSLKRYLNSFRAARVWQEHVVHRVLDDLVRLLDPLEMEVVGRFNPRGGIATEVRADHRREAGSPRGREPRAP